MAMRPISGGFGGTSPRSDRGLRRRKDAASVTALARIYAAAYSAQPNLGIADNVRRAAGADAIRHFCDLIEEEI